MSCPASRVTTGNSNASPGSDRPALLSSVGHSSAPWLHPIMLCSLTDVVRVVCSPPTLMCVNCVPCVDVLQHTRFDFKTRRRECVVWVCLYI